MWETHTVVGLDRTGPPHPPPGVDCVDVDLTSDESVETAFAGIRHRHGGRLLSVVHLAAYAIVASIARRADLPPEIALLIGEADTVSYDELQHTLGRLIHGEPWDTHEVPTSVAKAGAWVQGVLRADEEPFIKPWMIDVADDHYAIDITRAHAAGVGAAALAA